MLRRLPPCFYVIAFAGAALGQLPTLTDEQKSSIEAALPTKAPARPKKPRKLLVTNLNVRDGKVVRGGHASIPFGNHALAEMGKRTGAYETVFSNDVEMFRPGKIEQFDAICFLNTFGVLFEDEELRKSLLSFISSGKGFVGFHAAAATFVQHPRYDQWPVFGQMIGGTENGGHPWGPRETIVIKVEEAEHALNAVFKGQSFEIADEVFQFQEANLRDRLRVLLAIDATKIDLSPKRRILPIRQQDKDFPMTWVKAHGRGRVFYSSLGHNAHIYSNPALLTHFLAGIQYALGDLLVGDAPTAKIPKLELTPEQKKQIEDALPAKAPAKPKRPRRILVSNLNVRRGRIAPVGQEHPSIPFGNYAIEQMGKRTGAYETVFSNDVEMFRPDKIKEFDAVLFNNTVGVLTDDTELRESLMSFIAGGKGFIGFHAAAATFVEHPVYDQFPAFGQMVGGTENGGHPWKPNETITIKIDDPKSPLTSVFKGKGFETTDEVYQFQEPDLRGRLHVLLAVDVEKTDLGPKRRFLKIRMADKDFPMTWIKPHEKGRVFYSSLGHNSHIYSNPALLEHFLAGIQYALGDLKADDRPRKAK